MKGDENTTLKVYDSSIVLDEKFKNENSHHQIHAESGSNLQDAWEYRADVSQEDPLRSYY